MEEKKVLVLLPVTEEDKEYLVSRAGGAAQPCRFVFSSLEEATEEDIASSQIIIGRFPVSKIKTAATRTIKTITTARRIFNTALSTFIIGFPLL